MEILSTCLNGHQILQAQWACRGDQAKKKKHHLKVEARQVNCLFGTESETRILCWYEGYIAKIGTNTKKVGCTGQCSSMRPAEKPSPSPAMVSLSLTEH